jgi:hypothetical protein
MGRGGAQQVIDSLLGSDPNLLTSRSKSNLQANNNHKASVVQSSIDQREWRYAQNSQEIRKTLVGKQVKRCSDIILGGYSSSSFLMGTNNGNEIKISIGMTNYGHNDHGPILSVAIKSGLVSQEGEGKNSNDQTDENQFLIDSSGNSVCLNPQLPRLITECRKDSQLKPFLSGKTILAISDYHPGGNSGLQIDFSDQSSLRVSMVNENYGHGETGYCLRFQLIEGIDKNKVEENKRLAEVKRMLAYKKRDIVKHQKEIVEFIEGAGKGGDLASRELTKHILATTKENLSPVNWLERYSDLIMAILEQRADEWVRGPKKRLLATDAGPGLTQQERKEIYKHLHNNKSFTAKERVLLRRRTGS